jgi:hypothetical protein
MLRSEEPFLRRRRRPRNWVPAARVQGLSSTEPDGLLKRASVPQGAVSTARAIIPDAGLSPPVSSDEGLDGLNTSSEAAKTLARIA